MIDHEPTAYRPSLARVSFRLEPGEWPGLEAENMWAERAGHGLYRIVNNPFYVYGVSAEDIVHATLQDDVLTFSGVAERGGHSTYRLLLAQGVNVNDARFLTDWAPLAAIGCTFEGANKRWLAVDVPPQADIHRVYLLLEEGMNRGTWTFDEGNCGHSVASPNDLGRS